MSTFLFDRAEWPEYQKELKLYTLAKMWTLVVKKLKMQLKEKKTKSFQKKERKMEIQKEQKCGGTEYEEAIKIYYKA